MKRIEITREQMIAQLDKDIQMEREHASRFYSLRVSQGKKILENGSGVYSMFLNEEVEVVII